MTAVAPIGQAVSMLAASTPDTGRIPVTIIGGYLGAGKTTLVNRILREAEGVRYAVLVNDFGALQIDAELIESSDGDTLNLANGCICCSLAGGFVEALHSVLARPHLPDRVVIEASGVSDPVAIAQYAHLPGFQLDGVIVLADAETVRRRSTDKYVGRHVVQQVRGADLLVLNKIDLVTAEQLAAVRDWLTATAPEARLLEAANAVIPAAVLFGLGARPHGHVHTATQAAHDHVTWSFTTGVPLDGDQVRAVLTALPAGVVRAKGVVHLAEDPATRFVAQVVGARATITPAGFWTDAEPATKLVFIGVPRDGDADDEAMERTLRALADAQVPADDEGTT